MLQLPPPRSATRAGRLRRAIRRVLLLALLFGAVLAGPVAAATVSPMSLYLDQRTRSATLTLYNPNPRPEEIEITFAFGYPQTDAEGAITLPLSDTAPAGQPSAVPWLRAFPKRLVLAPGQQQVVRILATPPAGLAPGEYWGRVVVTARGGQPPIEQTQGGVALQIDVQVATVASLAYRNGAVRTGVEVERAELQNSADGVGLLVDLERTGNAAFLGRLVAELVGPDGATIESLSDEIAVYYTMRRKLRFQKAASALPPGARVVVRVEAERTDLPAGVVLPAAAVSRTFPVPG